MINALTDWLLPYQLDWLLSDAPRELCRKSRRTGMTLTQSLKMVLRSAEGTDQNVVSLREDSSKLVLRDCDFWIDWLSEHGLTDRRDWDLQVTKVTNRSTGATITALPAVPRLLRGRKGDVFIDEAAWIPDLDKMLDAAKPLQMWGGRISLVSSVFPVPSLYSILSEDPGWSVLTVDIHRAVSEGLYRRICEVAGTPPPSPTDEQNWIDHLIQDAGSAALHEYLCQESQGDSSWITANTKLNPIPIVRVDDPGMVGTLGGLAVTDQAHSIGVDVGGSGTITSIAIANHDQILALIETTNLKQPEIATLLQGLINPFTRKVAIDTNGIGLGLFDALSGGYRDRLVSEPNSSKWFRSQCLSYLNAIYSGSFAGIADQTFLADHRGAIVSKGLVSLARVGDRHCDTVPACAMAYQHRPESTGDIWFM
jgi:phage FluMu gp28-like protein